MHTVYKYPAKLDSVITIDVHEGAQLLSVQDQYGELVFWFLVDTTERLAPRSFIVLGTGHEAPIATGTHVGTVQQMGGRLVWHIFEAVEMRR